MSEIAKRENYIEKYNVRKCIREFRNIKTELQAYESKVESLAKIKKISGEKVPIALIQMWLLSLNNFVNVSRKLTVEQIEELSYHILTDYYYLNMADIYLIITNIKKGKYGQLYESLDGMKILSFFEQYADGRSSKIFDKNISKHMELKESPGERISENNSESISIKEIKDKLELYDKVDEAKKSISQ